MMFCYLQLSNCIPPVAKRPCVLHAVAAPEGSQHEHSSTSKLQKHVGRSSEPESDDYRRQGEP